MARFQPTPAWGSPGRTALNFQSLLSIRLTGMFCTGRYTRPVLGLKDIECQLCAPKALGVISRGRSATRAMAVSMGRPFLS